MTSAPGPGADDEAWRAIVAGFDLPPGGPVGRWPASEDVDEHGRRGASPGGPQDRLAGPAARVRPHPDDADDADDALAPPEPDEGHYEPPAPPPVPVAHPATLWAWVALVAGLLLLLVPALLGSPLSSGWLVVAVGLLAVGAVGLVLRLRDGPPTDSGPDDGAVV